MSVVLSRPVLSAFRDLADLDLARDPDCRVLQVTADGMSWQPPLPPGGASGDRLSGLSSTPAPVGMGHLRGSGRSVVTNMANLQAEILRHFDDGIASHEQVVRLAP